MTEIMVVDDDLDLRESMAEVLGGAGFAVTLAADGVAALEIIGRQKFDLILLDLVMPGLGGLEVMRRLREKSPRLPVIMLSAFASVENAVEAMRQGAQDYVTKPFRVDTLLTSVRRTLEEASFESCRASMSMDRIMGCLANPIRRRILTFVEQESSLRFMDICRRLEIEDHTKMNFHLKVLKEAGFLAQDDRKHYLLTQNGLQVMECARLLVKKLSG
ncbi:MAG: response regulator [Deltaproteobacteria bacterium]|nr:response regulator [Deltaproteobacteria bacterium]